MFEGINIVHVVIVLIVGVGIGYLVRQIIISNEVSSVEEKVRKKIEEGEIKSKEIILKAQEKAAQILEDIKNEEKERKRQLDKMEARLIKKEELLDKESIEIREREKRITEEINKVGEIKSQIEKIKDDATQKLEEIANLSEEQAKKELYKNLESKYKNDLAEYVQKMMKERRERIEKKSIEILVTVMQRYARSSVSEITTTSVDLPDEDFKGKIIGKEGRNIRTFERLTGVELIIDETPDSIIISSFDPIRRAIAKNALKKLIKDGRIQPAKIEEKVEEAKNEISEEITKAGEEAAYEVGIYDLSKEIIQLLGRLNYRTSYGQNVLRHSIEVANFAEMIASELGLDVEVAKRGGLLHDIGKSIDHEVSGSHVDIGIKILKKYNIDEKIVKAMESHHEEYPYAIPEAYVVSVADILSAARPGARRDTIENYLKRLSDLENIAIQFDGIKNAYAISAGRELRIFVTPDKINDFEALELSRSIAEKIQNELKYPGEIRVVVIRETRAVEYAK